MTDQAFINSPCPHLPEINKSLPITHTRKYRTACDASYFNACIELAQSLWLCGSPAQSILQLDKSMMAISDEGLIHYPYHGILWIIENTPSDQFIGNPVRHFQHLASRMNHSLPNADARVWRAWACLHLTEQLIDEIYPRDDRQIEKENLTIPTIERTLEKLLLHGSISESKTVRKLLEP